MAEFVHLRLHTEYSLIDGIVRVPELMEAVAAAGMPAVGLTDECNLFAMVKFYRAAQAAGVKPIIGVDLCLREAGERAEPTRLTLLVQNLEGYRNLTRLLSRAYLEGQRRGQPLIERSWLTRETTGGLLALSGAQQGDIGRALINGRKADARRALEHWIALFGDRFYIEVQRVGRPGEDDYIEAALGLVAEVPAPLVATNDVRFIKADEFESHEARVCIHEGRLLNDATRVRRYTQRQHLRSPEEMADLFADLPEVIENTVEIARRCSLELKLGESRLPLYEVPGGVTTEEHLRVEARRGLDSRLSAMTAADAKAYERRLAMELDVICPMGFAGYFLIVADFCEWARRDGIPVGPGRGSGAGSLVAWCLRITDLDPIEYDLLFERFLNPERVSMPDFDIDFCMQGRDRVIGYVADKYGREKVSQIITYGTMAAKAVVRDAGRVLGLTYGFCDRIAKLVPFELGITLDKAIEDEAELKRLYESDEEVRGLIDLARSLEGLTRNAGTNASGVVIAPSVLTDFTPLYCEEPGATLVTQFDKDDVEQTGLVKFDFLGLRTLTIIDWAVKLINAERARQGATLAPLDITKIPMDDAATYRLLCDCKTNAIFQLESRGMKDLIRRLRPDRFEDIVALVALFRPGPLQSGMVDDFIARKHQPKGTQIDYLHPKLQAVLAPTYGVILYQEQVMQIAQVLAGYTLGGADLLRRAMGKKKPEEMAKQRSVFTEGAVQRGVPEVKARHIFDLMEKFAGYGFNKSHSAAYALLSYQTAWLKTNHPAAFMTAVLSAEMDRIDKMVAMKADCDEMQLTVEPPDVNASSYKFTVSGERSIRYGLGAVKGVGESAVQAIIDERTAHGAYASIEDLCRRLDLNRVNKRVFEALIKSGSLDSIGPNRATLWARLPAAMQLGEQSTWAISTGQVDLFGLAAAAESPAASSSSRNAPASLPEWPDAERLAGERETLGLFLTGHPVAQYEQELRFLTSGRITDLASGRPVGGETPRWQPGKNVTIAGIVLDIRKRQNRTTLLLDDRSGQIEVTLFDDVWQQHRRIVEKDAILVIEGQLKFDEFIEGWRLTAKRLQTIDEAREQQARRIVITWPEAFEGGNLVLKLVDMLKPYVGGPCSVAIKVRSPTASALVTLDEQWSVRAAPDLIEQLSNLVGRDGVRLIHGPKTDALGAVGAEQTAN